MSTLNEPGFGRYEAKTRYGNVKLVCAHGALSSYKNVQAHSKQYHLCFDMPFRKYWLLISRPCEVCCEPAHTDRHNHLGRHSYGGPLCGDNLIVLCWDCMMLGRRQSSDWLYGARLAMMGPKLPTGDVPKFTRLPTLTRPSKSVTENGKSFGRAMARKVYLHSR